MPGQPGQRPPRSTDVSLKEHGSAAVSARRSAIAPVLAVLSCVLFCCNGELLQALQTRTTEAEGHASPLLNLALCHLGGLIFVPHFLCTKESFDTSDHRDSAPTLPPWLLSLFFTGVLMGYNYCWLLSTKFISIGLTNAVFQTSVAIIYVASTMLFSEPITTPHIAGVGLAMIGSVLAANGASTSMLAAGGAASMGPSMGVALALLAAFGFAAYQILFRYWFYQLKNNVRFVAYFGAWISMWHILLVFPIIWLADVGGIEHLTTPHGGYALVGTIVSAVIASTVNALYLCIIMWGTPMLLPCTSALSVPLTVALDFSLHGLQPSRLESLGHGLVVMSVVLIMDLHTHVFAGVQHPKVAAGKFDGLDDL